MLAADTITEIFKYVNTGGVIGLFVFIIIAGSRKIWVWGWQFRDLEDRYKKVEESNLMWMQLALRGANNSVEIAKTIVEKTDA